MMAEPKPKAAEKPVANGNGNGRTHNLGAIIVGGLALLLTLASGFWQLANPRTDISDLNKKIEAVQRDAAHEFLTLREFSLYKEPTERRLGIVEQTSIPKDTISALQSRIDRQDARIERLEVWFKDSRNARPAVQP